MNATILHLIVPLCVIAVTPSCCWGQTYSYSSYADGKQFRVEFRREDATKGPQWKADEENPPLSPRKVLKLANAVREKLVKDSDDWKWRLSSLALVPTDDTHEGWFWLVHYNQDFLKGDLIGIPPSLTLAVLMDGTVPEPTVKKEKRP